MTTSVKRFTGQEVPATGVSIRRRPAGSRRCAPRGGLPARRKAPSSSPSWTCDRMAEYQAMAADLRAAGIRAEVYLGKTPKNFGNQLKYADKRGSPVAVIQGSDEAARGVVQLKGPESSVAEARAGRDARGMEIPARTGRSVAG